MTTMQRVRADLGPELVGFDQAAVVFGNGTPALEQVDLTVRAGEFVSIVGPSGCGKSTLLRVAAGLQSLTAGHARIEARRIGFVFQDATLLPWRTVRQNVALPGELDKLDRADRNSRADRAIDSVSLTGFADHLPHMLSGGMRMRVSVARALTSDPELFLFDEPFGALDEITREHLNDETAKLFADRRFAGLFVTHSVAEAVYLSTRVVVMSGRPGRVLADIPIPFDHPRERALRFTPEFNEIAAHISDLLRGGHR
ncbi:MAG: transporter [Nocardia sp.]|uniref:ABC transporter ATP-binding protein n=1 Tax=Nocardia sp. TaxID=1821 RepID=UPI003F8EDA72|nr:transporter [Nocardia sp.]